MKICFVGCVEFSASALKTLFRLEEAGGCSIAGVITKSSSGFNADFVDLATVVEEADRSPDLVHYYDNQQKAAQFIASRGADVVFCFGWSSLLGPELLSAAPKGVIGFHPAHLPENRGRHPIIWALALGLEKTASTFFRMDEGADSGPILSQQVVPIDEADNAQSLYRKITDVALGQIEVFTRDMSRGKESYTVQDDSSATYWRKRSPADGLVDWRMEASHIHNLVRALYHPYPGAEFSCRATPVKLWVTRVSGKSVPLNLEPGKVLAKDGANLLVKCGGSSAIWLCDFGPQLELQVGDYL